MKKILKISGLVILSAMLLFFLSFMLREHKIKYSNSATINIVDNPKVKFINTQEVRQIINAKSQYSNGQLKINIAKIEAAIEQIPAIANAEVYSNVHGKLFIDITQRQPLFRVINKYAESYYIDIKGKVIPSLNSYTVRTPIVSGNIVLSAKKAAKLLNTDSLYKNTILDELYKMTLFTKSDQFLDALIEQIYITAENEIILIPQIGKQEILLGNSQNIKGKLRKLKIFYSQAMKGNRWQKYSIIDLRFEHQVICK